MYANIKDVIVRARVSENANKSGMEGGQACLGCDLQKQLMWKIPVLAGTGEMIHGSNFQVLLGLPIFSPWDKF